MDFGGGRLLRERLPFLRELIDELDRVRDAERFGLRAEVFQEIAQMHVRHHRAVGDELARLVAAVEAIAPGEPSAFARSESTVVLTNKRSGLIVASFRNGSGIGICPRSSRSALRISKVLTLTSSREFRRLAFK